MGSDYIQICNAHRTLLGVSLFHDSKITPASKYQTAAEGSRQKQLYTCTYMHGTCIHSCCKTNFFSMIHQHEISIILSKGNYSFTTIYSVVDIYWNLSFSLQGTFTTQVYLLLIMGGSKYDLMMLW